MRKMLLLTGMAVLLLAGTLMLYRRRFVREALPEDAIFVSMEAKYEISFDEPSAAARAPAR